MRPYDLRHSYGTALYRAAGDTRLVKDVLGHSDSRMTERYSLGHVPEAMRAATAVFEEHLAGRKTASLVAEAESAVSGLRSEGRVRDAQPAPAADPPAPPTTDQRRRPAGRLSAG